MPRHQKMWRHLFSSSWSRWNKH